jgi:hypothetical protein
MEDGSNYSTPSSFYWSGASIFLFHPNHGFPLCIIVLMEGPHQITGDPGKGSRTFHCPGSKGLDKFSTKDWSLSDWKGDNLKKLSVLLRRTPRGVYIKSPEPSFPSQCVHLPGGL